MSDLNKVPTKDAEAVEFQTLLLNTALNWKPRTNSMSLKEQMRYHVSTAMRRRTTYLNGSHVGQTFRQAINTFEPLKQYQVAEPKPELVALYKEQLLEASPKHDGKTLNLNADQAISFIVNFKLRAPQEDAKAAHLTTVLSRQAPAQELKL